MSDNGLILNKCDFAIMTKDKKHFYTSDGKLAQHVSQATLFGSNSIEDISHFLRFFEIERKEVVIVEVHTVVSEMDCVI
ncbi:hypothetical protein PP939_gp047 [Rhizobium phage RL38J1]|uniref:Uncharacterized protein n=1 Tax=Rhizobium phage RL38J1 TaxID=2663232 RepID=A0A6B9J3J3_9CAUD|nr:hypothetical protein PP939_gp047 [Rhizobium phage RL38J1]QGZ14038.1 hypothetical protein RL38J1_047 [Rhizobium phage RL38J1]